MDSSQPARESTGSVVRYRKWLEEFNRKVDAREARIAKIVAHARHEGLDANPSMVHSHLAWFERWYSGNLATGYLMNRTGIKPIPRPVKRERSK